MNLEALALARAQEQIDTGAWRRTDDDETEPVGRFCHHCAGPITDRRASKLCASCRRDGWTAVPCPRCGGSTKRRDQQSHNSLRGLCGECRAAIRAEAA